MNFGPWYFLESDNKSMVLFKPEGGAVWSKSANVDESSKSVEPWQDWVKNILLKKWCGKKPFKHPNS